MNKVKFNTLLYIHGLRQGSENRGTPNVFVWFFLNVSPKWSLVIVFNKMWPIFTQTAAWHAFFSYNLILLFELEILGLSNVIGNFASI